MGWSGRGVLIHFVYVHKAIQYNKGWRSTFRKSGTLSGIIFRTLKLVDKMLGGHNDWRQKGVRILNNFEELVQKLNQILNIFLSAIPLIGWTIDVCHAKFPDSRDWAFTELGKMVQEIVVDLTARRSPIPSGGLEIKLKLYFRHTGVSSVEQLRSFLSRYEWEKKSTFFYHDTEDDNVMTNMFQDHITKKTLTDLIK